MRYVVDDTRSRSHWHWWHWRFALFPKDAGMKEGKVVRVLFGWFQQRVVSYKWDDKTHVGGFWLYTYERRIPSVADGVAPYQFSQFRS